MHIFVKDDPYHSGLGLVDSQLKNFVLAFIEAPASLQGHIHKEQDRP